VLVTGATGFVGGALLDALLTRPACPVTAVVRRETRLPAGVRVCRVDELGSRTDWSDALTGCRVVVHLAARVHIMRDAAADPLAEYRSVNVAGTMALARQAAHAGVKRFIFVSTIKVNGENTLAGAAFNERDPPAPADPYGVSKAEAEAALLALASSTKMEVVVIRPPLVYGPGVKANLRTMMRWLARGVPLPLGAIRDNRRTLVALDNLVDLIITCVEHPAAANQVWLAGDSEALSTTDLLRRMAAALGVRARLIPLPVPLLVAGAALLGRSEGMRRLCGSLQVDTSKARQLLGWSPPVTVDEGLRRMVSPLLGKRMAWRW
jgi:nucleoside-diphosphate-sugar epimerase